MRAFVAVMAALVLSVCAGVASAQVAAGNGFANVGALTIDVVTASVTMFGVLIALLFFQASRKQLSCLDLITDKGSNKMSLTKVLNLIGGLVGIWTVMRLAIDKSLSAEIFGLFLLYCASTHAFSTYLSAKFKPGEGAPPKPQEAEPQ